MSSSERDVARDFEAWIRRRNELPETRETFYRLFSDFKAATGDKGKPARMLHLLLRIKALAWHDGKIVWRQQVETTEKLTAEERKGELATEFLHWLRRTNRLEECVDRVRFNDFFGDFKIEQGKTGAPGSALHVLVKRRDVKIVNEKFVWKDEKLGREFEAWLRSEHRLDQCKDRESFNDLFNDFKIAENKSGAPGSAFYALRITSLTMLDSGEIVWTELNPREVKQAEKLRERRLEEEDKFGCEVRPTAGVIDEKVVELGERAVFDFETNQPAEVQLTPKKYRLDLVGENKYRVSYSAPGPGIFGAKLVFSFFENSTECTITRHLRVRATRDLAALELLQPKEVYSKKPKKKSRARDNDDLKDVVKAPRRERGGNGALVGLKKHNIPSGFVEKLQDATYLISNGGTEGLIAPESDTEYVDRFRHALWAEEFAAREKLADLDCDVVLKDGRWLMLPAAYFEPRQLISSGDVVRLNAKYEGVVEESRGHSAGIYQTRIRHGMKHSNGAKVHVHFVLSRTTYRLAHQALDDAKDWHHLVFPASTTTLDDDGPQRLRPIIEEGPLMRKQYDRGLNKRQELAVTAMLDRSSKPFILFGPPGTGKTRTLVEAAIRAVCAGYRVLVAAPTNYAADLACERLGEALGNREPMKRIYAYSREAPDHLKQWAVKYSDDDVVPQNGPVIVVATLVIVAKLRYMGRTAGSKFHYCMIDEAGCATEPATIGAFAGSLRKDGRLILAGDYKQLGPVILSPFAKRLGLQFSMLELVWRRTPEDIQDAIFNLRDDESSSESTEYGVLLKENYRSLPDIIAVPSARFYGSKLYSLRGSDVPLDLRRLLPEMTKSPVWFHGVAGLAQREGQSPSYFNADEALIIRDYLRQLSALDPATIGVIAPYQRQCEKIKSFRETQHIDVGSVEAFQGQERRVILVSTVRSDDGLLDDDTNVLGFVANAKRFNVAVTRAQDLLIIVGNPTTLEKDANWRHLMTFAKDRGTFFGDHWVPSHPSTSTATAPSPPRAIGRIGLLPDDQGLSDDSVDDDNNGDDDVDPPTSVDDVDEDDEEEELDRFLRNDVLRSDDDDDTGDEDDDSVDDETVDVQPNSRRRRLAAPLPHSEEEDEDDEDDVEGDEDSASDEELFSDVDDHESAASSYGSS